MQLRRRKHSSTSILRDGPTAADLNLISSLLLYLKRKLGAVISLFVGIAVGLLVAQALSRDVSCFLQQPSHFIADPNPVLFNLGTRRRELERWSTSSNLVTTKWFSQSSTLPSNDRATSPYLSHHGHSHRSSHEILSENSSTSVPTPSV